MKIYLAGGLNSNWQEFAEKELLEHECINPKNWEHTEADVYTYRDLDGVYRCDLVLAYMEKENPSGIGMSLEIGYAVGIGKPVIFVNECDSKNFDIIEEISSRVFSDLRDAIYFIKNLDNLDYIKRDYRKCNRCG